MRKNIAIIGCGYWGKNLIRNYFELGSLYSVCDDNVDLAKGFASLYSCKVQTFKEIIEDDSIDGVVLASPPNTHKEIACALLAADKNIFVEKPLCMNIDECNEIKDYLSKSNGILMVGHLLHYHPGYRKILSFIKSREHGAIKHIISKRNSFGRVRSNEDVLWSFAPHDISMILGISGCYPISIHRRDYSFIQNGLADISNLSLGFESFSAHINVSWIHPQKEQELIIICEDSILIFDDTLAWGEKVSSLSYDFFHQGKERLLNKQHKKFFPLPPDTEPLKLECNHFLDLLDGKVENITGIEEATSVIQILEDSRRFL